MLSLHVSGLQSLTCKPLTNRWSQVSSHFPALPTTAALGGKRVYASSKKRKPVWCRSCMEKIVLSDTQVWRRFREISSFVETPDGRTSLLRFHKNCWSPLRKCLQRKCKGRGNWVGAQWGQLAPSIWKLWGRRPPNFRGDCQYKKVIIFISVWSLSPSQK